MTWVPGNRRFETMTISKARFGLIFFNCVYPETQVTRVPILYAKRMKYLILWSFFFFSFSSTSSAKHASVQLIRNRSAWEWKIWKKKLFSVCLAVANFLFGDWKFAEHQFNVPQLYKFIMIWHQPESEKNVRETTVESMWEQIFPIESHSCRNPPKNIWSWLCSCRCCRAGKRY